MTTLRLRGRDFTPQDIRTIKNFVKKYYDEGRTYISRRICEELEWKQPNGWLKDRACRDVLLGLEKEGVLQLPPRLIQRAIWNSASKDQSTDLLEQFDLETTITEYPEDLQLEFAKSNEAEKIWNQLVDKYHYLGYQVAVGRTIKYLIKSDARLVGAIGFNSPAWHLDSRDDLLLQVGIEEDDIRSVTVNNFRFLILPNVNVPNLASTILALATRRVFDDWTEFYSIAPKVVETFVQPSRFKGTCYKAANWLYIGKTKGYGKSGTSYHNSQEPKLIFIYGLTPHMRKQLRRQVASLST